MLDSTAKRAKDMSVIPASGEIDVRDAPKITPVEFVMQIIENIKAQISTIDAELMVAAQSSSEVRLMNHLLHEIKTCRGSF